MRHRITHTILAGTASLAAIGGVASAATTSHASVSAASRHVEGRVVSINRSAQTFTVRSASASRVTVKVTPTTKFDRIAGFKAVRVSERLDVHAVRSGAAWKATKVEPLRAGVHHSANSSARAGSDDPAGHDLGDDRGAHREPGDR